MRTIAWETASQTALRNCPKTWGEVSIYVILVKRVHAIKYTFWQGVAAIHEEQMSPFMILVLF